MSVKETPYSLRYDELEEKGLNYYEIHKIMRKDMDRNEILGKVLYIYSETEYLGEAHFCSVCGEQLTKEDFFFEVTDYCCDLWYRCPCGAFNHFKEASQYPLKIGNFVKICNSMYTYYGKIASLDPLKARINDKVTQILRGNRITIVPKENVPKKFLDVLNA